MRLDLRDRVGGVPTFASSRDRLTYLAAKYRTPVLITLLAVGVWATYVVRSLPSPPDWVLPFVLSWGLLAIPAYVIQLWLARKLHDPDYVLVGVVDPGDPQEDGLEQVYGAVKVPPDMWETRDETGFAALSVRDATDHEAVGAFDYVVTRFVYHDALELVEVRGCEQAGLAPADRHANAAQAERYYKHMEAVRRLYGNLKATLHSRVTDVHDAVVMQLMLEGERAELVPDARPAEQIEQMEAAVEQLPEGPGEASEPSHARAAKGELGTIDEVEVSEGTFDSGAEALAAQPEPEEAA